MTGPGQAENEPLAAGDLSQRYLWGPAVDQLLADEQVVNGLNQQGNLVWTLTDNQNTVTDLATYQRGDDDGLQSSGVFGVWAAFEADRHCGGSRLPLRLHRPADERLQRKFKLGRGIGIAKQRRALV